MSALDHIKRYPSARTATIAYLTERDKLHEKLRREVLAKQRRDLFAKLKRGALWPSWVWRW